MYKLVSYIKFLLSSTNQHGVHSPFVYDYVTKCLYSNQKPTHSKLDHVVLGSTDYFNVKNACFTEQYESLRKEAQAEHPSIRLDKKSYDLILIAASGLDKALVNLSENIHNDTLVIVDAIYKCKANTMAWKNIKALENVIVTIDMYHCGAVFFRKEQVHEHFTIRI